MKNSRLLVVSLAFAPLLQLSLVAGATPSPVSFPWVNITLDDGLIQNRGLFILLSRNQPLGLRATTIHSNLRVRNARDCLDGLNASETTACQGSSGGTFNVEKSNTFHESTPGEWPVAVVDPPASPNETITHGTDVAKFPGVPEITDFPIEVWTDQHTTTKSAFPLGRNSSFVDALVERKIAPSRIWGLFFGSRSQTRGVDGNLTIGGYDRARVEPGAKWTNFTIGADYMNSTCPLQVLLDDIVLHGAGGSSSLFADGGARVPACIDPLQNQFTFTPEMVRRFVNLTGYQKVREGEPDFKPQVYPKDYERWMDTLTVKLSGGFEVTIPHYELISEERGSDPQGKYAVVNSSRIMVASPTDIPENEDIVPILGGTFLSQVYLLVDYRRGTFGMALAVLGKLEDDKHDVVPLYDDDNQPRKEPRAAEPEPKKSVVGPAVGGVFGGLIAAGVFAFLFFGRRKGWWPWGWLPWGGKADGRGNDRNRDTWSPSISKPIVVHHPTMPQSVGEVEVEGSRPLFVPAVSDSGDPHYVSPDQETSSIWGMVRHSTFVSTASPISTNDTQSPNRQIRNIEQVVYEKGNDRESTIDQG